MKMIPPLILRPKYYKQVEKTIKAVFYRRIYMPLLAEINKGEYGQLIENSASVFEALIAAIAAGLIRFEDGAFIGIFSAAISRDLHEMGAKFDKAKGGFVLESVPADVAIALALAKQRGEKKRERLLSAIDALKREAGFRKPEEEEFAREYARTAEEINTDFLRIAEKIAIPPKFTEAQKKIISEGYAKNLDKYVKGFTEKELSKLRQMVEESVISGQRAENIVGAIETSFGVAARKAKFLARQETSLLMSKMREARFKDVGITRYKWSTSHDERVREYHKRLDGEIFTWDDPPVTNPLGARNHPGEDFNCRCIAVPILDD